MSQDPKQSEKAKIYQKKKELLSFFHLAFTPAVLWLTLATPLSVQFKSWAAVWTTNPYGMSAFYFLWLSLYSLLLDLPLSYYSGFMLEHQFELSNQSRLSWIKEFAKKSALSFVFSLILIQVLYALIWNFPDHWWIFAWSGFAAVSYGMGKIFPVWIIPLFYKYGPVGSESLKKRIMDLAARYGLPIENVYTLNLSKTTKKANAAFMGIGRTRRVVLSDTLIDQFSEDEIETVVAHELGHFKHRDIWRQLALGLVTSLAAFWAAFRLMNPLAEKFGLEGAGDIASLPLLFLIFYGVSLILMPLQNGFSRWLERAADRFALQAGPDRSVFISCMEKLGQLNLANPHPHPAYEWFFYDHPAIHKRIQMARDWKA